MIVIDTHKPEGDIIGTIGGGAIEHLIRQEAIQVIREKKPKLVETSLKAELGMCCGGNMQVFIEPIAKRPRLFLFGAGHINQALCPLAIKLGFLVSVIDERKDLLSSVAFVDAEQRMDDISLFSVVKMSYCEHTFVVIATHDHALDQKIVEGIIGNTVRYAALVGSVRKALMTKKRLLAKGFLEEQIKKIICPAGLNISASTPEEIAVSIAAQMTMVRNEKTEPVSSDSRRRQELATECS